MPPPSLSTTTMRTSRRSGPQRGQRAGVVDEGDVADEGHRGLAGAQGDPDRRRQDTVDAVGTAVGVGRRRRSAEPLQVADRHRGGHDDLRRRRAVGRDEAGDGRFGERRLRAEDCGRSWRRRRRRRRAIGRSQSGSPAPARAVANAPQRTGAEAAGDEVVGVDHARPPDLHDDGARSGDPLGQHLRRRRSTEADDDLRPLVGEPVVAQEGVVGRDGAGDVAAPGHRRRPATANRSLRRTRRRRRDRVSRHRRARDRARGAWSSTSSSGTSAAGAAAASRVRWRRGGSGPGSPTSGSRNGRFRWTGPVRAASTARAPSERHTGAAASSGTPGSWNQRTARPYRWAWSIDCGAPTSRSSGGRSAVSTSIGTSDRPASTTAGRKFAAAVPLVQSSTAGVPASPSPRATNAALRSSWTTCTASSDRAVRARAIGVLREPGATTAWPTPHATSSSTKAAQHVACAVAWSVTRVTIPSTCRPIGP